MTDPGGRPVKFGGAVITDLSEGKAKEGTFECEPCSPKDLPTPTPKQVRTDIAEREVLEGMAGINAGWVAGTNPNAHRPSRQNPNAKYDPKTKKFIPGSGFYDRPQQRPMKENK